MSKEIVEIKPSKPTPDVTRVEWHLGYFCNHNCSYCTEFSHKNDKPDFLSLEKFKKGLNNLTETSKKKIFIEFTGGEPTLNPDFINILKYAKFNNRVSRISFTSNGHKSTAYYKKCLEYSDSITLSYHMEYDDISLKKLEILSEYSIPGKFVGIKVHIMFLPGALERVKAVKQFCDECGLRCDIRRIRPAYYKEHPDNEYWDNGLLKEGVIVKPFDTKAISSLRYYEDGSRNHEYTQPYYSQEELDFLNKHESNYKNTIVVYDDGSEELVNVNELSAKKLNKFKGWICNAGLENLRIAEDGTVTRGSCTLSPLGNIFTDYKEARFPVVCPDEWCCSATTINVTKQRYLKGY